MHVRRLFCSALLMGLAFLMQAQVLQPVHWNANQIGDSVVMTARIDSGWHMTLIAIGDSILGEEYEETCSLTFPMELAKEVTIRYNACDDQQCTSPESFRWNTDTQHDDWDSSSTYAEPGHEDLWYIFWMGLLGGLLSIFTPCIWPIIPMTVSFFLKRSTSNANSSRRDALLYGLSIVFIYVGLGLLLTLLFGASVLNMIATSAIANVIFFIILVIFAISFFGVFEITLPSSWSTRLDARARNRGGLLGIVMMAFTLVIVSFSCTGPIIGTLLVEAAGRSLLAPVVGMLGFSMALALPFALFAWFPNWMKQLPRSGSWMQSFKVTLAFLELALSLKFLSVADMAYGWGILPRWLFIALWIVDFAALGIYLVRKNWLGKLLALASWMFVVYLIPGLWGAPVRMIAAFAPPQQSAAQQVFYDYNEGLQYAQRIGKPVLLQFSGYGCVNCRKMEQYVLQDSLVEREIKEWVQIVLYVDSRRDLNGNGVQDGDEYSRLQQEKFGSNAQPYWFKLSATGQPVGDALSFTISPEAFLDWLHKK